MSKIDLDELEQVLLLSQHGSCTCLTKTHEAAYHDDSCRYKKLVLIEDGVRELIRRLREAERDAEKLRNALSEYANPLNWGEDQQGIRRVWIEPDTTTPEAYNGFELARKGALEEAAKICDQYGIDIDNKWNRGLGVANNLKETADDCTEAIRALKEQE